MALVSTSRVKASIEPFGEQVLNLVVGVLGNPVVDGLANGFGLVFEVDLIQAAAVIGLHRVEELREEWHALLTHKASATDSA